MVSVLQGSVAAWGNAFGGPDPPQLSPHPVSSLAPDLVQGCWDVPGTSSHGTPCFCGLSGAPSTSQYSNSQPCWTSADQLSLSGQRVDFRDRLWDKTDSGLERLRGAHCLEIQLRALMATATTATLSLAHCPAPTQPPHTLWWHVQILLGTCHGHPAPRTCCRS